MFFGVAVQLSISTPWAGSKKPCIYTILLKKAEVLSVFCVWYDKFSPVNPEFCRVGSVFGGTSGSEDSSSLEPSLQLDFLTVGHLCVNQF